MATILVVDDSPVDRTLIAGLLEGQAKHQVRFAADGEQAFAEVASSVPDLIVSDLLMPGLDGLGLVARLRSEHPGLPVILMTSRGSEELAVQALNAGAASYVPKRKLAEELNDTVRHVLNLVTQETTRQKLYESLTRCDLSFVLGHDCTLFPQLISYLQQTTLQLGLFDEADNIRVGVALEEALLNALYHGNLEVSSELRERDDDSYYELVESRRKCEPYRNRRIYVRAELTCNEARFAIRDEGQGFDPSTLPDPTAPENIDRLSGRGLLLMRTFMDEIRYNEVGNEVTLVKRANRLTPMREFES